MGLFFPKYIQYNMLLVRISFIGLIYMVFQPLVFILLYNNKVSNLKLLNFTQYIGITIVYLLPFIFSKFNEQYWLLMAMTIFIIIQGLFAIVSFKTIK